MGGDKFRRDFTVRIYDCGVREFVPARVITRSVNKYRSDIVSLFAIFVLFL